MLVLTRKTDQVITLGDDITIRILRTASGSVKIGIEAPRSLRVMREESIGKAGSAHRELAVH